MIRFLIRSTGFVLLAAGAAQIIVDGTRSIAAGAILPTSLGQVLAWCFPVRYPIWQVQLTQSLPSWLADSGLTQGLPIPFSLLLIVLGALLLLLARPPARRIGFLIDR